MLLLVLILVVIAFGLLVVALLSGSVLWAWVSVGVSVVAAVVLLVDWLQRRAAVKAGAAPAVEPSAGAPAPLANAPMGLQPGMGRPPMADMDPATEVLPIVPSSPRGGDETVVAQVPKQPDARPSDAQQTVVMPAVQPSGSPARPSSAEPTFASSSAISSPTVTGDGVDRSDPGFGTGDGKSSSGAAAAAAEAAAVSDRKADDEPVEKAPSLTEDGKSGADVAGKPAGVEDLAARTGSETPDASAPDDKQPAAPEDGAAATVTTKAAAATPPPSGSDVESTVKVEAHQKAPAEPPPAASTSSAAAPPKVDLFGAPPVRQPVDEQAPPEEAPTGQSSTGQSSTGQSSTGQAPAGQDVVDEAPVGEAPEEPHDPVAAEVVSGLDDEVVVVDEQPRYHVTECRGLVAVAVIPLPVREAVELGFTPCGWCSPDRTLAGRHQTASR